MPRAEVKYARYSSRSARVISGSRDGGYNQSNAVKSSPDGILARNSFPGVWIGWLIKPDMSGDKPSGWPFASG